MSCTSNTPNINKTFIIEPLSITGGSPTLSACTTMFTNLVMSCSGDTSITMGSGLVTFNSNVDGIDSFTANTVEASTYFSGGTNLLDIINNNDSFVTGGTFSDITDSITLLRNDGATVVISGLTNTFTTGGTYDNNTALITFSTNSQLSAYTVDLSSLDLNDTFSTGGTLTDGTVVIRDNQGGSFEITGFSETFTGNTSGSCISDLYVSNIYGCSPVTIHNGLILNTDTEPNADNIRVLGTPIKRFRELNAYSGNTTIWNATQKVVTPSLELGFDSSGNTRTITANNSIIQDDCLLGGSY